VPKRTIVNRPDEEKQELLDNYVRLNLKDRDDINFNFEEDLRKFILKNLNVKKLIAQDKKYMKRVNEMIAAFVAKSYLPDILKIGRKQANRYKRNFTENG